MKWFVAGLIALPLMAHDPITTRLTYTRDISRLINRRCIACHDAKATVPLSSYALARPWAKAIRDQVMSRQMPPWGAVPGFGPNLEGDPTLTVTEIDTVIRWVEGGAPEGDAALLPKNKPPAPGTAPALSGPLMKLGCEWRAPSDFTLLGIRPQGIAAHKEMRITLTRPDGAVLPVIWLREVPKQSRDFVFVKPLTIPRGSVLRVQAGAPAEAALALSPTRAWLRLPETEIRKQTRNCPAAP